MEVRITFVDGPLHGQTAMTDHLDQLKVFFPPRERRVLAYKRDNEINYVYDHDISVKMTEKYDATVAWFSKHTAPSLRFEAGQKGSAQ